MARTQSTQRREQIMHAAAALFVRQGYHRTTVTDILEKAGIARGTFYLYFKSKQQLFDELLDEFLGEIQRSIARIQVESPEPPLKQLEGNFFRLIGVVKEYRNVVLILLGTIEAPDEPTRVKVDAFFKEVRKLVASSIQTGRELGLISQDIPVDIATHFVFGALKEVFREVVARSSSHRRRLVDSLIRLTVNGLLEARIADNRSLSLTLH